MSREDRNKTGLIFNIQKFSVNDGPGIRTVVFFKGCPLHCRWCSNPESQLHRTQILWNQKKCRNCRHCTQVCPLKAISLLNGHVHINPGKCSGCKECISSCPEKALELEGEYRTVQDVMDVVLQDQVFYEESGGGLTLSGGEVLSQPEFAMELLSAAKDKGLNTCCETTGFSAPEIFDRVTGQVDYLLFDMKHWDPSKHKEGTGVTNELPLLNMKHAIERGQTVLPRIPVIPGFNNTLEDASCFAGTLHGIGAARCQLLPFHQFGENKYSLLDMDYDYQDIPSLHREDLQDYLKILIDSGIDAFF